MFIVTGANGFIGSAMVRELNRQGHTDIICVDVVDRVERPEPLRNAQFTKFIDPKALLVLAEQMGPHQIKCIYHMGAISTTTETDWSKLVTNNIELSQNIFALAQRLQARLIYASSAAVYGDGSLGFSDSSDPNKFKPLNLYGKSKLEFDLWALAAHQKPDRWVGLRFFNVYGPNEYHKNEMASVVYKAFLQIKSSQKLKLFKSHNPQYEDGRQLRDFVYVKDITRWMYELYLNDAFKNGIYNMGFGKARTWLELAEATFLAMNTPMVIDWLDIPTNIRNQYQYFTEADMSQASAAGLSAPQFKLETGITDYLKNYLLTENPFL